MKIKLILLLALVGLAAGCDTIWATKQEEVPEVRYTNELGLVQIIPRHSVTNYVPRPVVDDVIEVSQGFMGPYGTPIAVGLSGLLAFVTGLLNRRKNKSAAAAVAVINGVNTLLAIIETLPNGPKLVTQAKEALRKQQLNAGVWKEVNELLKKHGIPALKITASK